MEKWSPTENPTITHAGVNEMNVLGNCFLICVAFICLTNCYRGSDLKSKYVIGVMWCLSNMWTVFFVRNNWRKRRRRSRRRITSYCGKFCSNYFVLFSICFLFVLQFQNVSLSLRQIWKTQNIQCLTPVFPSLTLVDVVWKTTNQETVRTFRRRISVHKNLICIQFDQFAWIPNHSLPSVLLKFCQKDKK